ncbi:MAG TPA: glycoside hydrolase family 3 protein [Treponema sp.]|nr:glycoside hydrolase family 3 protein [Treponema sp.]
MKDLPAYKNPELAVTERAKDLVSRMSIEEAMSQLRHESPAIPRLEVQEYNWWNEALHGIARAGTATVFPQAIALASSFDPELLFTVGTAISDEGRAKYHQADKEGDHDIYKGLTFWSPNINIFRDPRWGRGHETYGEDPWLTSRLGIAFVHALQGDHPKYMKAAACAKHFAVHSGPENLRHSFDAVVSEKDLRETYLPAFRDLVKDAGVEAVMGAYNSVNGEPACANTVLLEKILRTEWKFKGHVVTDCWAIKDFHEHYKVTKTPLESVALALERGVDLNCGSCYYKLGEALAAGLIKEEWVRRSAERVMATRIKLGMFDPKENNPYANIPYSVVDSKEHSALSLETARRTLVLLKNDKNLLPLDRSKITTIAVIGPNADSVEVLKGNYSGTPSDPITVLRGIRLAVPTETRVLYSEGSHLFKDRVEALGRAEDRIPEAVSVIKAADVAVLCLGLDPNIEGEEGDASNEYGAGDKQGLGLPECQKKLLDAAVLAAEKSKTPLIIVTLAGSAIAFGEAEKNIDAIIHAWYPGAQGGTAIAELLFGDYSPSARLPLTFYHSDADLPEFTDYSMKGRTYRYFTGKALYPFGYGLSYTTFSYSGLELPKTVQAGESITVTARVKNTGTRSGAEISQLYVSVPDAGKGYPIRELRGVQRVELKKGKEQKISFTLTPRDLSSIMEDGSRVLRPGTYTITVGGHQGDERSNALTGTNVLTAEITVQGDSVAMEY